MTYFAALLDVRRWAFEAYHQLKYLIESQITPSLSRLTCYLLIMLSSCTQHFLSQRTKFTRYRNSTTSPEASSAQEALQKRQHLQTL